jgi:hypothetical protein
MMRVVSRPARAFLLTVACAAMPCGASASESRAPEPPLLVGSVGQFNFVDSGDGLLGGGAEYRWAPVGRWKLIPGAGVTFAEGGTAYGYAALHYDFAVGDSWFVTPVVGAGLFRNTDALDLGHTVQFKTGLEISLRVAGRYRIGLQGYHLSNASLDDDNPGTEVLELVVLVPVGGGR